MDVPALPRNPRPGDTLTVHVEAIADGGLGRGRFEALVGPGRQPQRLEVHARGALPGELVRVLVERRHRRRLIGRAVELLRPHPDRVEPRCPHHARPDGGPRGCGGCTLQSLAYPRQLDLKREHVAGLLRAAGLDPSVLRPVVPCEPPWLHRNKMEFSFGDDGEGGVGPGLHPPGYRHEVISLRACHLQSELSTRLAIAIGARCRTLGLPAHDERRGDGWLRTLMIREGKRTGDLLVELGTSDLDPVPTAGGPRPAALLAAELGALAADVARERRSTVTSMYWTARRARRGEKTTARERLLYGRATLGERLDIPGGGSLRFEIHPRAFFQPNTRGAERLYAEVLTAAGAGGGSGAGAHALDLYCGTGTIGICLAAHVGRVTGIELQPDAVDDARRNAALNGVDNATFHCGDVGEVLAELGLTAPGEVQITVVDPPRSGLSPKALARVAAIGAPRLVYVSCNPAALARDAALLARAGYRLATVTPVDQFPHTWHIETVAELGRG